MADLKSNLEQKVKQMNDDKAKMGQVQKWVDGLKGKVITFKSPQESYHIAFTKEKVALREGDYPSCEVSYRGDQQNLLKILRGEEKAATVWKTGQLKVWGSLSEAMQFETLL